MTCRHFPDLPEEAVRCSVCINGPETAKSPKPDDWWIEAATGAKTDPGEVLLENLLEGTVCPRCMTERRPIGCDCNRLILGASDLSRAADFLESAVEASELTEQEAAHLMMSAFKRASRRMPLDEAERTDSRNGLLAEFGVKPKWYPPRNTEPTHLPV